MRGIALIRISLERASLGDRLAKPVFAVDGKMLLNTGVELDEAYLARLQEHGVSEIFVRAPHTASVAAEDGVSDASRIETLACARACAEAVRENGASPARRVLDAVEGASDDLRRNRGRTLAVSPARSANDWWEAHARNVALLSVATAAALASDPAEIRHIGVGALLHDIGLVGLSSGPLWDPQQELEPPGRSHPVRGFQLLITNPDISANSAIVCLQHHERRDGSGFPKGPGAHQVALGAQICAIADTYDLLIAPPPFGQGIMAHSALGEVSSRLALACPEALGAFARAVAPYPAGTMLRMGDGASAVVLETAPGATFMRLEVISHNGRPGRTVLDLPRARWRAIEEVA